VYAARVKEADLTFVVSGMLWQRSLVMQDLETKSLWSHLLGQSMRGELVGETLELIPSSMTDWKTWRAWHPKTTVLNLSRTSRNYRREFYRDPAKFLVGVASSGKARAWSFDQLLKQPLVNDEFDDVPLLILFDKETATAMAFDRRVGEETLTFHQTESGQIADKSGSIWNDSGVAISGPHKGTGLAPQAGVVSYVQAWRNFHPSTSFWKAD